MLDTSSTHPSSPPGPLPEGNPELFALASRLFASPDVSIAELAQAFRTSQPTVKRRLAELRRAGVLAGRLGPHKMCLALLSANFRAFCAAFVAVEVDPQRLKPTQESETTSRPSPEDLLLWRLRYELAYRPPHKGRIIVEDGRIVMGDPRLSIMLLVHAASKDALFSFVREAVEQQDGVLQTRTLMIAQSAEALAQRGDLRCEDMPQTPRPDERNSELPDTPQLMPMEPSTRSEQA